MRRWRGLSSASTRKGSTCEVTLPSSAAAGGGGGGEAAPELIVRRRRVVVVVGGRGGGGEIEREGGGKLRGRVACLSPFLPLSSASRSRSGCGLLRTEREEEA